MTTQPQPTSSKAKPASRYPTMAQQVNWLMARLVEAAYHVRRLSAMVQKLAAEIVANKAELARLNQELKTLQASPAAVPAPASVEEAPVEEAEGAQGFWLWDLLFRNRLFQLAFIGMVIVAIVALVFVTGRLNFGGGNSGGASQATAVPTAVNFAVPTTNPNAAPDFGAGEGGGAPVPTFVPQSTSGWMLTYPVAKWGSQGLWDWTASQVGLDPTSPTFACVYSEYVALAEPAYKALKLNASAVQTTFVVPANFGVCAGK